MPPGGWPETLAVGNSGGPDSTCLLFLLSSVLEQAKGSYGLPFKLYSIHIDHDLQPANREMADWARRNANAFRVQHHTYEVPWGSFPFPKSPHSKLETFEKVAREARQNRLFHGMSVSHADAIALAHHADDQVETAVMRMAMGSGLVGLAGMRPVRRWGMDVGQFGAFAGPEGMSRWIVRPLLWFSKDRILETCETNELPYTNDPTNFQPAISIRNAVRHCLAENKDISEVVTKKDLKDAPGAQVVVEQIPKLQAALEKLREQADRMPDSAIFEGRDRLREVVRRFSTRLEALDSEVSNVLMPCLLPSPPSTLLLSIPELQEIGDPDVRVGIARRILRYLSPRPWGSLAAEAKGDSAALNNLVKKIWCIPSRIPELDPVPLPFSAPSTVQFWPMVVRTDEMVRRRKVLNFGEVPVWLAQRAPPHSAKQLAREGRANPLIKDLSKFFVGLQRRDKIHFMLYDCRFLLTFTFEDMPSDIFVATLDPTTKFLVKSYTSWFLPQVIMQRQGEQDQVLARFKYKHPRWSETQERENSKDIKEREDDVLVRGDGDAWIKIEFIRTLEAL
ncbi:hypothetical protein SCP_0401080 [Sparassis crispa]|uniref:tRNA(Ile)-lysidine synthetase n=1 Tax=Sparassis crispa TaxID=139825 RepID=A0A401GHS8_9APHY|nr:hypothetical protein SCP_0401080 [Sparassis crispa]GBE81737.1 hypothetical protein SCP_0401080 [Sparassis crispa]